MRTHSLRFVFPLLLLSAAANAQSVHWDPPGGPLPVGQATSLQLVFEDCEPKDTPRPPKTDGLDLQYAGQTSNMSWTNGSYSHSVTYSYTALLSKDQSVEIPSFDVESNKGTLSVAAARFKPTGATVGGSGEPLETAANSSIEGPPGTVWAGEVFDLKYRIEAARSYNPDFGQGAFDWKPDPLIAEDWSQPVTFELRSGSEPQIGLAYRTRAIIRNPGVITLNPIHQLVNLSIGMTGLGFFQQRQYQQFSVTSSEPTLYVRPLPPAPAAFSGAVGEFTLTSKVVPANSPVGEPITWTLELKGTGNWPDISGLPAREVSRDFQVVQPKATRTAAKSKLFDLTLSEDVVLIPTKAGVYSLEPVTFSYFDPKDGGYKTLTAQGATVTISVPANAETPAPAAAEAAQTGIPAPSVRVPPSPPAPPAGLPRDALPATGPALTPWSAEGLAFLLLAPLAMLIFYWLWLALRRARRTDPQRARREARIRLAGTLAQMRAGHPGEQRRLLNEWQSDAAILWEIPHAAPSVQHLVANGLGTPKPGEAGEGGWMTLWAESERALYGPELSLPSDWTSRAAEALAGKPAPGFALRQMFLPRNLLPWIFALTLSAAFLAAPKSAAADEGGAAAAATAYRQGDFTAAENAWKSALATEPANWSARYNLSLALAQQNRWEEAAAHAAAAFVQQPGDGAVRWQFALACEKAGVAPTALAAFLTPGPLQYLARIASPAAWQLTLIIAAWLGAAAMALLLARGFGPQLGARAWKSVMLSVLGLSAVVAGIAVLGWLSYGPAADARAVVTWRDATLCSIPTEADTSQKTAALPPGNVALADKSFLGWTRLSFENGQTGWIRTEEAIALWK